MRTATAALVAALALVVGAAAGCSSSHAVTSRITPPVTTSTTPGSLPAGPSSSAPDKTGPLAPAWRAVRASVLDDFLGSCDSPSICSGEDPYDSLHVTVFGPGAGPTLIHVEVAPTGAAARPRAAALMLGTFAATIADPVRSDPSAPIAAFVRNHVAGLGADARVHQVAGGLDFHLDREVHDSWVLTVEPAT